MARIRTALVVGGGIAGPAAALALHKAGISPTIYESYPRGADGVGGVLTLAPNGLDALRIIGLQDAVRAIGQPITTMAIADGRGRKFCEFAGLPGMPPSLVLWRADLHRVLREHAVACGIGIEFGKRLVGAMEDSSGITARFADGSSARADVLIGADGIRSTVRSLIDPAAPGPQYTGLLGFGGLAPHGVARTPPGTMTFVYGRQAFFGYWSAPDGRTFWFGSLPRDEPLTLAQARSVGAIEWLRVLRTTYAGDAPARNLVASTSAEHFIIAGAGEMLPVVPRWHRGRMVLVGDAAHAPSSSSGQGASLSIESSLQLARCLRDLPDAAAAFAAYERLRRARVEKVAADAARTNSRKAAGPVARAVMHLLMPLAVKTFLKPHRLFGSLHGYRIPWDDTIGAGQPAVGAS